MSAGWCAKCRAERELTVGTTRRGVTEIGGSCPECGSKLFAIGEPAPNAPRNWCAKCRTERAGDELVNSRCPECRSRVFPLSA